jgi:hypothetical protein
MIAWLAKSARKIISIFFEFFWRAGQLVSASGGKLDFLGIYAAR